MPATLQPLKAVKCSYESCSASFDTVAEMKKHKKYSKEHDYCHKCDEDFHSYDDFTFHKAIRPDRHNKACRVCGEEFKSDSGLNRHVTMAHPVDQKIPCIGCNEKFFRASLLTRHLEFGFCEMIRPSVFYATIIHKHLVHQLLNNQDGQRERFFAKMSKHDAAFDNEEDGGIQLGPMDEVDETCSKLPFESIKPIVEETAINPPKLLSRAWPELPSVAAKNRNIRRAKQADSLESTMNNLLLDNGNVIQTPASPESSGGVSLVDSPIGQQVNTWKAGNGTTASKALFPNAKQTISTPRAPGSKIVPTDDGVNIFRTRFWDPDSEDFKPERFYDPALEQYLCPFVCEQAFDISKELEEHIKNDHRITVIRCPRCQRKYANVTSLIAHCESHAGACRINRAEDFNEILDRLSGGFLSASEEIRPDHQHNPAVLVENQEGRLELYQPPAIDYIKYEATKPTDWKEKQGSVTIGKRPFI